MKDFTIEGTAVLNVDITSDYLIYNESSNVLNYDVSSNCLVINNSSMVLNFELKAYDSTYAIYRILLDWLEAMSVGDIF